MDNINGNERTLVVLQQQAYNVAVRRGLYDYGRKEARGRELVVNILAALIDLQSAIEVNSRADITAFNADLELDFDSKSLKRLYNFNIAFSVEDCLAVAIVSVLENMAHKGIAFGFRARNGLNTKSANEIIIDTARALLSNDTMSVRLNAVLTELFEYAYSQDIDIDILQYIDLRLRFEETLTYGAK